MAISSAAVLPTGRIRMMRASYGSAEPLPVLPGLAYFAAGAAIGSLWVAS